MITKRRMKKSIKNSYQQYTIKTKYLLQKPKNIQLDHKKQPVTR